MTNLFSPTVVAFLSAMHMGLVLLVLPAFAVQTDYIALEKRLVAVESAMPKLEKIASRYRTIEDDITLHLAVVRREEAKIQRNYAEYEALIRSWTYIVTLDPKGTESKLNQTQKQTKELRSALTAWSQQVQQARQAQEEICANKARIDSGSPRQVAQWNESGSRLLETNTTQLQQKQRVLTAAWSGLNSVSSELGGIQLGRLEGFLLKKEEYLTAFSRMTALADTSKVTCSELEKDLAKARELRNELKELMKKVFTFTGIISPELEWLQKQVAADTDFLSNTDRAALKTRIDSALARLESTTLSHPLPVVPELDSLCKTFINASSQLDSAKIGANLQQVESIVTDARSALSKARAALKEASNAQAGFDGLRKARSCLSSLRRAQADAEETDVDEAFSLVEELQTRIEDAQRREHLFTIRNQKNHSRVLEIQQIVKEAQLLYQNMEQVIIEFVVRHGPLPSDQVLQNLEQLLPALAKQVEKLEKASQAMAQAIQDAEQRQQIICERAANAGSIPLPTSTELQTWHQESQSALNQVRPALEAAAKKVQVEAGFVASQTREVSTAKDKLITVKDSTLIKIRGMADIAVQLTRAQEMFEQALTGMQEVDREIDELGKLKESALEELKSIQDAAAELAPRLVNTATITELKAIETGAAVLADRYRQATVAGRLPPQYDESSVKKSASEIKPGLKIYSEDIDYLQKLVSKIIRLIKKADSALEQAKSVREASVRIRSSFTDILTKADKCVSDLATAISSASKAVAKARQVLDECDYNQAQTLIDGLYQGPKKDELAQKLADGRTLEDTLKSLVNQARGHYRDCQYDQARTVLKEAEQKAQCQKHVDSIADKLAKVKARQELEAELRSMVDEANALYRECRFNKVLDILNRALAKAKCQKHKKSINDKIKLTKRRHEHEKTSIALAEEANRFYKNGKYQDALAKLRQALKHTSCQRFRDSLDKKIAKVQGKIDSGDCSQCSVYENWLKKNARACGYHGNRLPSICEGDPECIRWNKECNRVKKQLRECLARCQRR